MNDQYRSDTEVDPDELAEWTAANRRAIESYRTAPNALITARMAR